MTRPLKPPKGVHITQPRVCVFCRWYIEVDSFWGCRRDGIDDDGGPVNYADVGDMTQWMTTCDLWRLSHDYDEEQKNGRRL